jgi:hypothetical protein
MAPCMYIGLRSPNLFHPSQARNIYSRSNRAPSLLQVAFVFFLPESPRFLVSKDRHEEALKILVKFHAEGDEDSEFVKAEMAEIKTALAIELEHSKRSWFDMVKTAGMRRRVVIGSLLGLFTQLVWIR